MNFHVIKYYYLYGFYDFNHKSLSYSYEENEEQRSHHGRAQPAIQHATRAGLEQPGSLARRADLATRCRRVVSGAAEQPVGLRFYQRHAAGAGRWQSGAESG